MNVSSFSSDYGMARSRFRKAAEVAGAALDMYMYPESGPGGEELYTDIAWIGPRDAPHVFMMVSGTHGVEGFCGSGAQIDWLESDAAKQLPPGTAALLVHAINPYGFAWRRRVTHENVDLNRNWIDFREPLPANDIYDEIATLLCPREWTEEAVARTTAELIAHSARMTFPVFKQAVSGGQYRHPLGLFFGGTAPTVARRTLTSIFSERLSRANRIGIVDFHSGLGAPGSGQLIVMADAASATCKRARNWWGEGVKSESGGESVSAQVEGGWIGAAPDLAPHATVTAIALEIGTVDVMVVLQALRADNWLHAYGDPTSAQGQRVKQQICNAFYVDSDAWRAQVLEHSRSACRQAIAGLNASE